jgi:hypothetical protein
MKIFTVILFIALFAFKNVQAAPPISWLTCGMLSFAEKLLPGSLKPNPENTESRKILIENEENYSRALRCLYFYAATDTAYICFLHRFVKPSPLEEVQCNNFTNIFLEEVECINLATNFLVFSAALSAIGAISLDAYASAKYLIARYKDTTNGQSIGEDMPDVAKLSIDPKNNGIKKDS